MVLTDFSGNFTNVDNCNGNDIGVVTGEGKIETKTNLKGEPYEQLTIDVEVNEKKLQHSPRMSEGKELQKAWGKDSKDWIGKKFSCKVVNYRAYGQEKTCIEIVPIKEK